MSDSAICPRCSSAALAPSRWADEESACVACGYVAYHPAEFRKLGIPADKPSAERAAAYRANGAKAGRKRWAGRSVPDDVKAALARRYAAGGVTLEELADEYDIAVSTAQRYAYGGDPKRRPLYNRRRGLEVDAPDDAQPAPPMRKERRGRRIGEHRILAQAQIDEIRRRAAQGEYQNALAKEFGVTPSVVHNIVWRVGGYAYDDLDTDRS